MHFYRKIKIHSLHTDYRTINYIHLFGKTIISYYFAVCKSCFKINLRMFRISRLSARKVAAFFRPTGGGLSVRSTQAVLRRRNSPLLLAVFCSKTDALLGACSSFVKSPNELLQNLQQFKMKAAEMLKEILIAIETVHHSGLFYSCAV